MMTPIRCPTPKVTGAETTPNRVWRSPGRRTAGTTLRKKKRQGRNALPFLSAHSNHFTVNDDWISSEVLSDLTVYVTM